MNGGFFYLSTLDSLLALQNHLPVCIRPHFHSTSFASDVNFNDLLTQDSFFCMFWFFASIWKQQDYAHKSYCKVGGRCCGSLQNSWRTWAGINASPIAAQALTKSRKRYENEQQEIVFVSLLGHGKKNIKNTKRSHVFIQHKNRYLFLFFYLKASHSLRVYFPYAFDILCAEEMEEKAFLIVESDGKRDEMWYIYAVYIKRENTFEV